MRGPTTRSPGGCAAAEGRGQLAGHRLPSTEEVLRRLKRTGWLPRDATTNATLEIGLGAGGSIQKPGFRMLGSLYIGTVTEPLRILDAADTASGYQANALGMFRAARRAGFDGIRILDQLQSKGWGNVYHESVGLFPRGLAKMRWTRIDARNYAASAEQGAPGYGEWKTTPEYEAWRSGQGA